MIPTGLKDLLLLDMNPTTGVGDGILLTKKRMGIHPSTRSGSIING
jgi:hypothetical protein